MYPMRVLMRSRATERPSMDALRTREQAALPTQPRREATTDTLPANPGGAITAAAMSPMTLFCTDKMTRLRTLAAWLFRPALFHAGGKNTVRQSPAIDSDRPKRLALCETASAWAQRIRGIVRARATATRKIVHGALPDRHTRRRGSLTQVLNNGRDDRVRRPGRHLLHRRLAMPVRNQLLLRGRDDGGLHRLERVACNKGGYLLAPLILENLTDGSLLGLSRCRRRLVNGNCQVADPFCRHPARRLRLSNVISSNGRGRRTSAAPALATQGHDLGR